MPTQISADPSVYKQQFPLPDILFLFTDQRVFPQIAPEYMALCSLMGLGQGGLKAEL